MYVILESWKNIFQSLPPFLKQQVVPLLSPQKKLQGMNILADSQ